MSQCLTRQAALPPDDSELLRRFARASEILAAVFGIIDGQIQAGVCDGLVKTPRHTTRRSVDIFASWPRVQPGVAKQQFVRAGTKLLGASRIRVGKAVVRMKFGKLKVTIRNGRFHDFVPSVRLRPEECNGIA
jgi:hypothetical protein